MVTVPAKLFAPATFPSLKIPEMEVVPEFVKLLLPRSNVKPPFTTSEVADKAAPKTILLLMTTPSPLGPTAPRSEPATLHPVVVDQLGTVVVEVNVPALLLWLE